MRVLLVHNRYQLPGGEDIVFSSEAQVLNGRGHDVEVYQEDNRRIAEMSRVAVGVRSVWSRRSRRAIARCLKTTRPDVAHFHNTFPLISPSAYSACREMGVPVVQTLHNYRPLCPAATFLRDGRVCEDCLGKTVPWPSVLHGCYRGSRAETLPVAAMLTTHRWLGTWRSQVDMYVAVTDFVKRKFIEGGFPAEKITVKPHFVDPDPGPREDDGRYVVFVGRLTTEKGIETLLQAWQKIRIPLKLVGDGPLMRASQVFAKRHDATWIEFVGGRDQQDVLSLIKGARFLVFPSEWYETFGRVAIEAFACGVPVVASRLGAMAEIVADGRTGLHFTPGDAADLAAKAEWAWTHPEEMREMGAEARREYERKYTAERNYERLMQIYEAVRS